MAGQLTLIDGTTGHKFVRVIETALLVNVKAKRWQILNRRQLDVELLSDNLLIRQIVARLQHRMHFISPRVRIRTQCNRTFLITITTTRPTFNFTIRSKKSFGGFTISWSRGITKHRAKSLSMTAVEFYNKMLHFKAHWLHYSWKREQDSQVLTHYKFSLYSIIECLHAMLLQQCWPTATNPFKVVQYSGTTAIEKIWYINSLIQAIDV